MATGNVVPRKIGTLTLIKCYRCKALYSTDKPLNYGTIISGVYEPCPVCGCRINDNDNKISLWRYNLIKWWRERIAQ